MAVVIQTGNVSHAVRTLASGTPSFIEFAVTITAGSDLALYLMVGAAGSSLGPYWNTPTFDGVALTSLGGSTGVANSSYTCFELLNPPSGTHNVRIENSIYAGYDYLVTAIPCSGVDQTTPHGTVVAYSSAGSASPRSSSVTTGVGGVAIAGVGVYPNAVGLTQGGGQTLLGGPTNYSSRQMMVSYLAGATSMGYSWSGSDQNGQFIVPINATPVIELTGSLALDGFASSGAMAMHQSSMTGSVVVDSFGQSGLLFVGATLLGTLSLGAIGLSGSLGPTPGVITSPVLKNNTGTVLSSLTGVIANVYHATTGALIVRKTGLVSNGSGIVTISDSALVAGTSYVYEIDLSGSALGRRLPVGVAA